MKYVSINSVPNLSTGAVMGQVTDERRAMGDECWCIWGRGRVAENDYEYNFGSKIEFFIDVLQTRLDGRAGFHSKHSTKRLLKKLDEIGPDIVHIHNIHGYYVNVEMLFEWLVEHKDVKVIWTLHDCWAFTGHCSYFTYVKCEQWRRHCGKTENCPQPQRYPKTYAKSSCVWNFEKKRDVFTRLPTERMTLITPSYWLEGLVKKSYLAKYPVEVRHNTIDTSVFRRTPSDFRERYGIGNRFMILGVASTWSKRKGLDEFISLANTLDPAEYAIVLIGLSSEQIRSIPQSVIGLGRKPIDELVEAYSAADVFVHPGVEETFGLVVAEAGSCGAKVIVMKDSACVEAICGPSIIVDSYETLLRAIETELKKRNGNGNNQNERM